MLTFIIWSIAMKSPATSLLRKSSICSAVFLWEVFGNVLHINFLFLFYNRTFTFSFIQVFSERDALNLLKGEEGLVNTSINFIMKQRLNNKPQADKSKPFLLLRLTFATILSPITSYWQDFSPCMYVCISEMSNKVLMKTIVEAQDSNESLQLKVEFEQPLWDKLKQNKIWVPKNFTVEIITK